MATQRPLHLIIADLTSELRVAKVAGVLAVSEALVYKHGEDPERSGKPMSLTGLLKLIEYAAQRPGDRVQRLVDELLNVVVPGDRVIVRREQLERVAHELRGIFTGEGPAPLVREQVMICNECGDPLQVIAGANGRLRYECGGCR